MQKLQRPPGRAYAFFQSPCTTQRIQRALDTMKAHPDMNIPQAMEMVADRIRPLKRVTRENAPVRPVALGGPLLEIAATWARKGANYAVESSLPEATSQETAGVLGDVFNLLYSCSPVLGRAVKPIVGIFFRNGDGAYVSKLSADTEQR